MPPSVYDASLAASREPSERELPYLGGPRGRAVAVLSQGLRDHQGPLLLTGSAGVGKSVVLKAVLATLADEPIRVINLGNADKADWNHRDLAGQILGRPIETSTDIAIATAIAELTTATAGERQVIIAVDDAHTLTDKALELLLLIASPVRGDRVPPQLILAGRDGFFDRDWRSELQVIARLAKDVTIDPLAGSDARDYITSRLTRRDASADHMLTADALSRILQYSGGLPGEIDRILAAMEASGTWDGERVLTGGMEAGAIASRTSRPSSAAPTMAETALVGTMDGPASPMREPIAAVSPPLTATAVAPAHDPEVTVRSNLRMASPSPRPGDDASVWREAVVPAPKVAAPASAYAPDGLPPTRVALPLVRPSARKAEDGPAATSPETAKSVAPASVAPASGITRGQMRTAVAAVVIVAVIGGVVLWRGEPGGQVAGGPATESGLNRMTAQEAAPREAGLQVGGPPVGGAQVAGLQAGGPTMEPNRAADRQPNRAEQDRSTEPIPARPVTIETASPSAMTAAGNPPADTKSQAVNADRAPMPASPASTPVTVANDLVAPDADKNTMPPNASAPIETPSDASAGPGAMIGAPMLPVAPQPGADRPNSQRPQTSRAEGTPPASPVSSASPVSGPSAVPSALPSAGSANGPVSPARASGEAAEDETRAANGAANEAITTAVPAEPISPTPQYVSVLLRRGDTMLQQGDVVAARLFYERAAAAGSGEGATSAGKTYDPNFLATVHAQGLKGDIARAIEWYRMASTVLGDKEAGVRLKVLTAQSDR